MQGLGQLVNLFLTTDAHTLAISLHNVAGKEVHLLGLQLQVATQVVIDLLHHTSPLRVAGVGLALMHQDALDDTILLGLLGQRHQSLVGVVVVGLQHALHPLRSPLHIAGNAVGQEAADVDAAYGHMDNANRDVLRQRGHHGAAKPVGRRQSRIGTTQGCRRLAPLTLFASLLRKVYRRHQQEARTRTLHILSLRTGCTLHVRLSETQEDIEIGVYGSLHLQRRQQRHQHR